MKAFCNRLIAVIVILFQFSCAHSQKEISNSQIDKLIDTTAKLINENYVFPDVAQKIEKHLKSQNTRGNFNGISTKREFAITLTMEMQSISHDKHMRCRFRGSTINPKPSEINQNYDYSEIKNIQNFGFFRTGKIDGDIGYLEIFGFPSLERARESADAAMKTLQGSKVLIVDNRRNGGGSPDMICYICSYFFEKPTLINSIYWRSLSKKVDFVTYEKVNGSKFISVPIYVLTSSFTFSGGEEFVYDIQTQKRGTIVGEVTGGGANPGDFFNLDEDFGIFIPTGTAINPITNTNWEGVGVKPDINIEAKNALEYVINILKSN